MEADDLTPELPPTHDEIAVEGARLGRYHVLRPLGAGGMGVVFAARDMSLQRDVALKLLRRTGSIAATRIEREAQAMARLAHPNVVTVFDVDTVGNQTFVAMELVDGPTLRRWLADEARGWREVVAMFVETGRGLAAAHDAGLVHRDFKPDNVLVDRNRRPRVTDFGLVDTAPERADEPSGANETGLRGTPAYMSPEQWAGGPVDARGDQFGFCVALWEALWGQRPFAGSTPGELRAAICAGQLVEVPEAPRVPRRLETILRRGLSIDPERRWADMPALLDALEDILRARRRRTVAAAAAALAIVSATFAAWIAGARGDSELCAPPVQRVETAWGIADRTVVATHLANIDPVLGAVRFGKIAESLDAGTAAWSTMYVEASRASRVEGRQSDTMLDRRMACLDRWLDELGATVRVVGEARDVVAIDKATRAATGLSSLAPCADVQALEDMLEVPIAPQLRANVDGVRRHAAEIQVEQRAGRLQGLAVKARAVVGEARALEHAPALVAALGAQARVDFALDDDRDAERVLRELVTVAARAHDDRAASFAWSNLIEVLGSLGKREEAAALSPVAMAAVVRAGDPPDLHADLLYFQATVADYGPHPEDGLALLDQARALLEQRLRISPDTSMSARLVDIVFETGTARVRTGNNDAAIASYREAIEGWQKLFGPDSPDEAYAWQNIGATYQRAGKLDSALVAFRKAAQIREARTGASAVTAASLIAIGTALDGKRAWADALAMFSRAHDIQHAELSPDDPALASSLLGRATAEGQLGHTDDAARDDDEAIAIFERGHAKNLNLAIAHSNRGELYAQRHDCTNATREYQHAITLCEELRGPKSENLIYPLVGIAACRLGDGHASEAIPLLERALAIPTDSGNAIEVSRARAYLGRARAETGRDVAAAVAMVRDARAELVRQQAENELIRELDVWLAGRR